LNKYFFVLRILSKSIASKEQVVRRE